MIATLHHLKTIGGVAALSDERPGSILTRGFSKRARWGLLVIGVGCVVGVVMWSRQISEQESRLGLAQELVSRGGAVVWISNCGPGWLQAMSPAASRYVGAYLSPSGQVICRETFSDGGIDTLLKLGPLVRYLSFNCSGVSDAGLRRLEGLPRVESLSLTDVEIGDQGMENLRGVTSLERIVLYRTRVTDKGLQGLAGVKHLRSLDVQGDAFTDAGMASVKEMSRLNRLALRQTLVTEEGLKQLVGLRELQTLELSGLPVTDAGVETLVQIPSLVVLQIEKSSITDQGVARLGALKKLKLLNLKRSRVSLAGFGEFKKLVPGVRVLEGPLP